jgi:two-component system, chemotaxis family, CheB/CheR fusion protein
MCCHILIVDDNHDAADTLAVALTAAGHETRVAYTGRDAIAMALCRAPDVVFVDLAMPQIDGYDLLRELRQLPGMGHAKLVCLTGFGDEQRRSRAQEDGCDGYLLKPAAFADILAVVAAASRESPQARANPV